MTSGAEQAGCVRSGAGGRGVAGLAGRADGLQAPTPAGPARRPHQGPPVRRLCFSCIAVIVLSVSQMYDIKREMNLVIHGLCGPM